MLNENFLEIMFYSVSFCPRSEQSKVNNISFNLAHSIFLAFVAAQEIRDVSQAISCR